MAAQSEAIIVGGHARALGSYPHARRVGELIFVSGTSSRREDNTHEGPTIHEDGSVTLDIRAQTRAVIENIRKILNEAGAGLEHVVDVHDLHASRIGTGLPVLTAHVVVEEECWREGCTPQLLDALQECVASHFEVSVEHSTFQLEPPGHAAHERGHHP